MRGYTDIPKSRNREVISMAQQTFSFSEEVLEQFSLSHKGVLQKIAAKSKTSSASTLLKYAGTWAGNDLEDCLRDVIHSRGEAQF
jgi:hypothetical protein